MPISAAQMLSTKTDAETLGFDEVVWAGEAAPKLLAFESGEKALFISRVVVLEEQETWKACAEMLTHSVQLAAELVKGFYGLDLLSLSLREGVQKFNANAFAQLIVNHAQKLTPGGKSYFQYGSFILSLTKRIPEAWGKIEFKTYVETFRKPRADLNLFIKKKCTELLGVARYAASAKTLVICDLSQDSIFRFGEEGQTECLSTFLKKYRTDFTKARLGIFFQHPQNGLVDLTAQCGLAEA